MGNPIHGGNSLRVVKVLRETRDSVSIVLDIDNEFRQSFAFLPGQYVTIAVPGLDGDTVARNYSISDHQHDINFQITVKLIHGGYVSNWLHNNLKVGDCIVSTVPTGRFVVRDIDSNSYLFAAGSGITSLIAIAEQLLIEGNGRVTLFYVNRDADNIIFISRLISLKNAYRDRFIIINWITSLSTRPDENTIKLISNNCTDWSMFVCGPQDFVLMVRRALKGLNIPSTNVHYEIFTSLTTNPFEPEDRNFNSSLSLSNNVARGSNNSPEEGKMTMVEVELDGEVYMFDDWDGSQTLLYYLESKGLRPPFTCREGKCSSCACLLAEGEVRMVNNEVLDEDDLAEGLRLSCQALSASDYIKIIY